MSEARTPAADGKGMRCRGWRQEGLLRLLENVVAVGEDPEHLVVYAALGKAARNRPAYEAIIGALKDLREGETLIVQSGKPIAILATHARAPLVLMANCNIVGRWAREEVFYDLEQRNLICWGGLTAGCWQYIGSQGVLQGTYEILARCADRLGTADLRGRFFLTAGLGGMGSAQPRAASMLAAASIVVEVDAERAAKRLKAGAVDALTESIPDALAGVGRAMSRTARLVRGPRRQCRRRIPGDRRRAALPGRCHRPDGRARSALRLRAAGLHAGRRAARAERESGAADRRRPPLDRIARRGDAQVQGHRVRSSSTTAT